MAKRFTLTEKWSDKWFMKLTPQAKIIWLYLIDNCDASGVWECNWDLMSFQIGFSARVNVDEFVKELDGKIEFWSDGSKLWVKKFIEVQYGELSEKCMPHLSVLRIIKKHTLSKGYPKGINTLKEREQVKEKDLVVEETIDFKIPTIDEVAEVMALKRPAHWKIEEVKKHAELFINFYQSKGWKVGEQKMKDWKAAANGYVIKKIDEEKLKPGSASHTSHSIDAHKSEYQKAIERQQQKED